MMRWRINTLMGQLRDIDPKAAEYREISRSTGVSVSTIFLLGRGTSKRTDLDVIDNLLKFFSEKLERQLTTQDLLEFTPDNKEVKAKTNTTTK